LAAPGSAGELAQKLFELARDEELRLRLGAAGRARAEERFSLELWRTRMDELYRRLTRR
jgi:glycosyltransferase involved in cell wall biosynthesis